jgi:hypothetical protein
MSNDTLIAMPKMFYKIIPKNSKVVYNEIRERTNNFNDFKNPEFKTKLLETLQDRNLMIHYGFLNESPSLDVNKQVVGKDGCYMTKTTENNNCLFIWHNRTTHQYEFWALNKHDTINAMDVIRYRIHKLSN